MHPLHRQSMSYWVRLLSLLLLATPHAFGQSGTNALPDLSPPYGPILPTFWEQHGAAALVGGLILFALTAVFVWKILKPGPQPVLPPAMAAREVLVKCRARPEDAKVLSEVSQALRHYLGAVFGLPPGELTTAECCRELERCPKITPQLARDIADFFRECDGRKFSPAISSAPLNAAGRALEFVALAEEETHRQDACAVKK